MSLRPERSSTRYGASEDHVLGERVRDLLRRPIQSERDGLAVQGAARPVTQAKTRLCQAPLVRRLAGPEEIQERR